jgi:hypothetical protein
MSEKLTDAEKLHSVLIDTEMPFRGKVRVIIGKATDPLGVDVFVDGNTRTFFVRLVPLQFGADNLIKLLHKVTEIMHKVGRTFWDKYATHTGLVEPKATPTREPSPVPETPAVPALPPATVIITRPSIEWFQYGFTQYHWDHLVLNTAHSVELARVSDDPMKPDFLFFWTLGPNQKLIFHSRTFVSQVEPGKDHLQQVDRPRGVTGLSKKAFEEAVGRKVANWKPVREIFWE